MLVSKICKRQGGSCELGEGFVSLTRMSLPVDKMAQEVRPKIVGPWDLILASLPIDFQTRQLSS